MARVILRRLMVLPLVLLAVTFLTFIVGYLAPGDPILNLMGNQRDPAVYENLRSLYGLDRPWYEQYGNYLWGLLHGDLGYSYRFAQQPVSELIRNSVSVSLRLGLIALCVSLLIGIPAGTIAALRRDTAVERMTMVPMVAFYAIPSFVLIPTLQWINYRFYARGWPSLPPAGWGSPEHWVLPVAVLAAGSLGYIARLTRANVLETMDKEYVRTARGKGLSEFDVKVHHILRNALLPIVTVIGPAIAFLVTGAFVVETLFSIPGVGFLSVEAISQRDYPVIQGTTIILAMAVVVMNLITDILYGFLDPRVRVEA